MWDREVDLVCIGAGIGGLAGAIATVDAGAEVMVADGAWVRARRGWLPPSSADQRTSDFIAGYATWVPGNARIARDLPVPLRVASPVDRDTVEPFLGSRLLDWAATCLTSPYGVVYDGVGTDRLTTLRAAEGGTIEVLPIGTVLWRRGAGAAALRKWTTAQAGARGIDVLGRAPLRRLVFEESRVVGAVFDTLAGPLAVRARRGVALAPDAVDDQVMDDQAVEARVSGEPPASAVGETRQVCLVARTASRFGRVELLGPDEPTRAAERRPTACPVTRRVIRAGLRVSRGPGSGLGRCGKVDRDPPVGQ